MIGADGGPGWDVVKGSWASEAFVVEMRRLETWDERSLEVSWSVVCTGPGEINYLVEPGGRHGS